MRTETKELPEGVYFAPCLKYEGQVEWRGALQVKGDRRRTT
jgi:hypothetical protein